MELKKFKKNLSSAIQKYKYIILVGVLGIVLMLIPSTNSSSEKKTESENLIPAESSIQDELENILSQIDGAGNVRVMLTQRTGAETIYQTNEDFSDGGTSGSIETVVLTDSDRNEFGLVKQVNPPEYTGAIILCQGASDSNIRLAVTDAVSKVTGLRTDKIAVLKMK